MWQPGGMPLTPRREMLTGEDAPWKKRVTVFELETDDAWARDVAPTFVKDGARQGAGSELVI